MDKGLKIGDVYRQTVDAEVVAEADVIVAGGGTAGCVAALAAARGGSRVVLVERTGSLGGMMTTGNAGLTKYVVHEKSQSDYQDVLQKLRQDPASVQCVGGLPMEITKRLIEDGGALSTGGRAGSYVFTAKEHFEWLLQRMLEEEGVRLRLHSLMVDVIKGGNRLKGIVIECKSGRQAILAEQFVDATGDGDVAYMAGVPFILGVGSEDFSAKHGIPVGSMQRMGAMFRMGNVDMAQCFAYLKKHRGQFRMQSSALMSLDQACESFHDGEMMTLNVTGIGHQFQIYNTPHPGVFTFCCPSYEGNGLVTEDLTEATLSIRREIWKRVSDMKKNLPGFQDAYLLDIPDTGVRETRHIQGEYVINIEDVMTGRQFDDTIGLGCHPIDAQPIPDFLKTRQMKHRWYFSIPYRSLVAGNLDNLLLAGRCISATHEAGGCTRPTVQCMITGEAAGTAAALCRKENVIPRELSIGILRNCLKKNGVILAMP